MSAGFFLFYESLYASYTGHRIAVNQVHAAPPPQKKTIKANNTDKVCVCQHCVTIRKCTLFPFPSQLMLHMCKL